MAMNAMQRALVNAGLAEKPKDRKRRGKQFKCNKCGEVMEHPEWASNVMWCPKCDSSYFIFTNGK